VSKWGTVVVLAALLATQAAAQTEPTTGGSVLTVEEAVALALGNNRGVSQAELDVARAQERVAAARTRRLPSLEVQALAGASLTPVRVEFPAGAFGDFPGTGPIPAQDTVVEGSRGVAGSVSATLAQPLTQLYRIGLNTRANELARDAEREALRATRVDVAAEVRRLYYELVQSESALQAAEEQLELYRELDRMVGQQVAREVALSSTGLEVKARLARQEYQLAALRDQVASGKERLNHLLGRALDQDFRVVAVSEVEPEEVDLEAAMARALQQRPDLAQARLAVEQADVDRRAKRAEAIPDVSLAVSYTSYVNVDLLPGNLTTVGLLLKWQPFDWGRRARETAEKTVQVEQARTGVREAESRARLEVAHQFRELSEARLLLEAERLGQEAAREELRIKTARHRQDAALLEEVLEAQAGLSRAQAQYDKALSTFWTAKADFRKALGEEL